MMCKCGCFKEEHFEGKGMCLVGSCKCGKFEVQEK